LERGIIVESESTVAMRPAAFDAYPENIPQLH
jgi:hypothetical protein